jgi:hypothetical protein
MNRYRDRRAIFCKYQPILTDTQDYSESAVIVYRLYRTADVDFFGRHVASERVCSIGAITVITVVFLAPLFQGLFFGMMFGLRRKLGSLYSGRFEVRRSGRGEQKGSNRI